MRQQKERLTIYVFLVLFLMALLVSTMNAHAHLADPNDPRALVCWENSFVDGRYRRPLYIRCLREFHRHGRR